ncbi:MAG: TlpA family protein disulfide reductase [Bacteroidia bacterium]|nr:TlpA family protein disulfide reductase [Bacteroidia bacterium]
MSKILGFLVLSITLLFGCSPEVKTVSLKGTIKNSSAEVVKIFNDDLDIEAEINEGIVSTTFDIQEPQYVNLRLGRESTEFYISPGQELIFSLDASEFDESISYQGEGSEISNYLADKFLNNEKGQLSGKELYSKIENEFLTHLEKQEQNSIQFLHDYSKEHDFPESFKTLEEQNIVFEQKNRMLSYESAHQYYMKNKSFNVSEEYQNSIRAVDLNRANLLVAPTFRGFIKGQLMNKAYAEYLANNDYQKMGMIGIVKAQLDMIPDMISDSKVAEFAANSAILGHLSYGSALGIDQIMNQLKSMTASPKVYEKISASLDEWGHLAKGKEAPDFEGHTLEGEKISLTDLKGKNIYIDVWATWCGPCKAEQPALFALEEKYKDNKNIAFVGVSIDENKAAWEKMVSEKEMKGIQIYTDNAWESTICNDYLIKGIPRFILVNKEGKIINADAPRPSSEQIKDILKELAGEPLLTAL